MASTEEVLSTLLADDYIHSSIQFLIDENMRTITVPPEGVVLGVTGDKDVNRINFKMVRFYDGLDLSTFQIRINYVNANGDANYYQVTDTTIEEDSILFTWLVSSDAAAYKGTVSFAARLYTIEDTIVKESFNSTVTTAEVLEGIIVDEYMPPDAQQDLIALLMSQIEFPAGSNVGQIDTTEGSDTHGEIFNDYERNEATGGFSHAEGFTTTASGSNSHAEGNDTIASGMSSHAEGSMTEATGNFTHAEGSGTKASSANQHVQGKYNLEDTADTYAMIIGNGTDDTARSNALTVDWNGNIECGTVNGVDVTTLSGGSDVGQVDDNSDGTGEIFNDYGNNVASGQYSHAEGQNTTASSTAAHAEGSGTTASKYYSHAEGSGTTASGTSSHAEGDATTASGYYSHAEGGGSKATADKSHAEGNSTQASGYAAHAEGSGTIASGAASHAEGSGTKASSANQHVQGKYNVEDTAVTYAMIIGNGTADDARSNALTVDWSGNIECGTVNGVDVTQISGGSGVGQVDSNSNGTGEIFNCYEWANKGALSFSKNKATGLYAHAEGGGTTASGVCSHAEGHETTASGNFSHTEGKRTTASGTYAHAEGENTDATGQHSHAEGFAVEAKGIYSHAEGCYTKASSANQHVQGKFNIEDTAGTYAMIIGNGTSDSARSNVLTVDWNGNIQCGKTDTSGTFTTNGTINGVDIVSLLNRVAELETKVAALEGGTS